MVGAADAVERDSGHLLGDHLHTRDDPNSNHLAALLDPDGTATLIVHALNRRLDASALVIMPPAEAA